MDIHQDLTGAEYRVRSTEPSESEPQAPDARRSATRYYCKVLDTTLKYTCQYKECKYWVDYEQGDNCLLAYAEKGNRSSFSMPEISYLTKLHISVVSRITTHAVSKLRTALLRDEIDRFELPQEFVVQPNAHVCVVCESLLQDEAYATTDSGNLVWCQEACYEELPYEEAMIEVTLGLSVKTIIAWAKRKFGYADNREEAISKIASLFHTDWHKIEGMCAKYDAEEARSSRKERLISRRTDRRSLRKLDRIRTMHEALAKQFQKKYENGTTEAALEPVTAILEDLLR